MDYKAKIEEIVSQLVWEFSLINNGYELGQHTRKEQDKLERVELKSATQQILTLLNQRAIEELDRLYYTVSNTRESLGKPEDEVLDPYLKLRKLEIKSRARER